MPDRCLRLPRHRVHEARMRAGAVAARLRAGADDGGEPAARDAAVARRSDRVLHAAAFARRCSSMAGLLLLLIVAPGIPQEARRSVPREASEASHAEIRLGDALPVAAPAGARAQRGRDVAAARDAGRHRDAAARRQRRRCGARDRDRADRRSSRAATASAATSSRSSGTAARSPGSTRRAARRPR